MSSMRLCGLPTVILVLLASWAAAETPAEKRPDVRLLRTPNGGLQPQAVVDAKGTLHLIYLKGDPEACDVFYTRRAAGQTNFSTSLRVNSQPGSALAIGTIRGAQLALGRAGRIHVVWNGSGQAAPKSAGGSPMLYTRLNDAGEAFEPQRNVMTSTASLDGGGSVAADTRGNVYVVWHAFPAGASDEEQNRAVFIAQSADDGQTFAPERRANPKPTGACSCCALKALVDEQNRLWILYRTATGGVNRDVTLLLSRDAGQTFQNTLIGPWRVATCPMSSMALAQGLGDTVCASWETHGQVEFLQVKAGSLERAAQPATPDGQGKRKHPVVAFAKNPGGGEWTLRAWTEDTRWARGGSLAWELVDSRNERKTSGRAAGVPAWSRITAVADDDGGFTIVY